ncbi:Prophage integrase IntA [uncultured Comamonas sp.]|nr:Prophage integrase IntA [uncultured Comamonas sp.]
MPKRAKELSAVAVSKLREPGRYSVGGVEGLQLRVTNAGSRLWIYRAVVNGKRRDIGLGYYEDVTLSQARDAAREKRRAVRLGLEVEIGQKTSVVSSVPVKSEHFFKDVALEFIESKKDEWRNEKHRAQWVSTLATYANPVIGAMDVRDIELSHVLEILRPIWATKTETATRLRGRIESVLGYAAVHEWRSKDNPAQWRGLLDKVLPEPTKIKKTQHHKAMPAEDVPGFMRSLNDVAGGAARALELLILTATRSGEIRGARWSEIDQQAAVWTIPAERMKAGVEHRVPLSKQALAVLVKIPRIEGSDLLFPGRSSEQPISEMTLTMLMRRQGLEYVPHGFRSTFRDWGGDNTEYPREILEAALAHTLGSRVEAAYRRKDALERRRPLMQDWADFVY